MKEILNVDGANWLVREAISHDEAMAAISMARCFGSVGGKTTQLSDGVETVLADVARLNVDGSERRPYSIN